MAAVVTSQTIQNGKRNLVVKGTIGGTTGDITDTVIVDVSALDSNIGVNGLTLVSASWSFSGFSAELFWDASSNVSIIEFGDGEGNKDFRHFGGIKNNAGSGATGDVLISTTGYTASGDIGFYTLEFRKT